MPKIKITIDDDGIGKLGEILDVSEERAERWVGKGFAELVDASTAKPAPKAPAKIGLGNGANSK